MSLLFSILKKKQQWRTTKTQFIKNTYLTLLKCSVYGTDSYDYVFPKYVNEFMKNNLFTKYK